MTRLQYTLAGSGRPCHAVSEQHSHRYRVSTTGRPPPRRAAVAQEEDVLCTPISIAFMVGLTHTAFVRFLSNDGNHVSVTATPAAISIVAVVDSQRRGDRRYSGR